MARPYVEDLPDPAVHVTRYAEALTVSNAKRSRPLLQTYGTIADNRLLTGGILRRL